jgi:hypothetical protein
MSHPTGKFREGEAYYTIFTSQPGDPVIQTWRYAGFHETPGCGSTRCDVPFHFHVFESCRGEEATVERIRIPSLAQAERSYLTWDELMRALAEGNGRPRRP